MDTETFFETRHTKSMYEKQRLNMGFESKVKAIEKMLKRE